MVFHSFPLAACPGQSSTQILQLPHFELSIGFISPSNFILVKTDVSLTADPYFLVIRSAVLPIHPSPALVAIVLCGSGVPRSIYSIFLGVGSSSIAL